VHQGERLARFLRMLAKTLAHGEFPRAGWPCGWAKAQNESGRVKGLVVQPASLVDRGPGDGWVRVGGLMACSENLESCLRPVDLIGFFTTFSRSQNQSKLSSDDGDGKFQFHCGTADEFHQAFSPVQFGDLAIVLRAALLSVVRGHCRCTHS